jgi:flagellar hook protein FlgE
MSIYGAISTAVSGLDATSAALSTASANIANVNTVGYKAGVSSFSTLLAASAGGSDISSGGVTTSNTSNVTQQGLLQSTQSPTDLAISGNGFFVVNSSASAPGTANSVYYTRAGNFQPDANGNLVNAAGYYLMGWPLDTSGNIPSNRSSMTPVNINSLSGKATPTTTITYQANLQSSTAITAGYTAGDMAAGTVTPDFQRTINVYDSQGGTQPLQLSFVKTGTNQWSYEVSYQGTSSNITGSNPIYSGTMSFNSDGTLANADTSVTPATGSISLALPWSASSGLAAQSVSINLGTVGASNGMTQFDSASTQVSSQVDGALFGSLTGVAVDQQGYVTAQFSNGLTQNIYKLPIATFANPDGLNALTGNAYQASQNSGTPTISEASTGGAGVVKSNSLESSTVDLASEFTNLITTQRAYAASSKIVTTASTMLDDLLQVVR